MSVALPLASSITAFRSRPCCNPMALDAMCPIGLLTRSTALLQQSQCTAELLVAEGCIRHPATGSSSCTAGGTVATAK